MAASHGGETVGVPECLTCRDVACIHVVLYFIVHMSILLMMILSWTFVMYFCRYFTVCTE